VAYRFYVRGADYDSDSLFHIKKTEIHRATCVSNDVFNERRKILCMGRGQERIGNQLCVQNYSGSQKKDADSLGRAKILAVHALSLTIFPTGDDTYTSRKENAHGDDECD
jgi:hypothetical protein